MRFLAALTILAAISTSAQTYDANQAMKLYPSAELASAALGLLLPAQQNTASILPVNVIATSSSYGPSPSASWALIYSPYSTEDQTSCSVQGAGGAQPVTTISGDDTCFAGIVTWQADAFYTMVDAKNYYDNMLGPVTRSSAMIITPVGNQLASHKYIVFHQRATVGGTGCH